MYARAVQLTVLVTAYVAYCVLADGSKDDREAAIRAYQQLAATRKGLTALKRVVEDIDADLATQHRLEGIVRKRSGLNLLRKILTEMDADVVHEQKRACQFNLGGHCATESAASLADQWHYLNSPLSPGRKRRDTRLYRKLVSGQLLQ